MTDIFEVFQLSAGFSEVFFVYLQKSNPCQNPTKGSGDS